jgi:carbon monoxide dehydrogenase subunit G
MKINGSYTLQGVDLVRAYAALQDPQVLTVCIPGCESLEKIGDAEYAMKMKMALAAVSGQFTGKVRIVDPNPPSTFKMVVEGSGKIGFMKGEGLLNLTPADRAVEVVYDGEVQVGGTMAAIGQRLIDTTSKMMIKRFFDKLSEQLAT